VDLWTTQTSVAHKPHKANNSSKPKRTNDVLPKPDKSECYRQGIAVMSPQRVKIIPDLKTSGEQGLPGVEASVWNAFFLPPGAPAAIVRKLNKAMSDTLDDPTVHKRLEDLGLEIVAPDRRTPEYLAKFVPEEIARWTKVVRDARIPVN
jgi:putative tricarboxylic transport membrane protein